jgi:hypothetical protein
MSFALNEVEAMAKRASRGAGYPWGLAEEAGKATRWLCAQQLDGCAELAKVLEADFAKSLRGHTPATLEEEWKGQSTLCPLGTGAILSDLAAGIAQKPVTLHDVMQPSLILPFAAYVARKTGGCVMVTCDAIAAVTDGYGLSVANPFPNRAATLVVQRGGTTVGQTTLASRATPTTEVWATLNRLAHRTYAPATEQSRLLGAGAGLSDND